MTDGNLRGDLGMVTDWVQAASAREKRKKTRLGGFSAVRGTLHLAAEASEAGTAAAARGQKSRLV